MTSEDLAARLRDWKNVWLQDSDQPDGSLYIEAADALAAAQAENERLTAELDELDFLRHEGGPDSVAGLETRVKALEAENERLRDALRQVFDVVYNDNGDVTYDTHTMARAHKLARAALGEEG